VNNGRSAQVRLPLPVAAELQKAFEILQPHHADALTNFAGRLDQLAGAMTGSTLAAVESMVKTAAYRKQPIADADVARLKKQLVEQDCNGLIEFIESGRTLEDLYGQEPVKKWLRQDFALWRKNDLAAMPMGYLLCGPVGTGKTYMVECLAGEAGVPVVKLKNFRDKWVGSTEGNLEKIFRLLQALGRCFVFVDEADQTLGKRDADAGDGGLGGRVYSMLAQEMSNTANRGKIVWVLASSRPDLIEVDLKRPGRVDVKIPLLPSSTPEESFGLIRALCKKRGVDIPKDAFESLKPTLPDLLTPGAAETLAVKVYRTWRTAEPPLDPVGALKECLSDYRHPVAKEVMNFQIKIAVAEASDADFVPEAFRNLKPE
jgi:SpoVK/Ycf46/Vps4 family AAA+-type ATPase